MRFNKLKGNGNAKNIKNFVLVLSMLGMFSNANYSFAMQDNDDDSYETYDVSQNENREYDDEDDVALSGMKNGELEDSNDVEHYDADADENENSEIFETNQNYKKLKKAKPVTRKTFQLSRKNINVTLDDFMNEIKNYSKGMFSNGKLLNWLVRNKKVELNKQNKNIDISYFVEPCTYFKSLENNKKINVAIGVDENKYIHFYAYSVRPMHVKSALSKLIVHESVLKQYLSLLSSVCNNKNKVQELLLELILNAADRLPEVRMKPDSKSWDTELCVEFLKTICPNSYTKREINMLRSANYELPIEKSKEKNTKEMINAIEDLQIKSRLPKVKRLVPDSANKKNRLEKTKKIKLNYSDKNNLGKKKPLNIQLKSLPNEKETARQLDDDFQSEVREKNIVETKYNKPKFKIEQVNKINNEKNMYENPEEQVDYDGLADDIENEEIAEEDIDFTDDEDYTE